MLHQPYMPQDGEMAKINSSVKIDYAQLNRELLIHVDAQLGISGKFEDTQPHSCIKIL